VPDGSIGVGLARWHPIAPAVAIRTPLNPPDAI
jgi:hypothetical protein